LYEETTIDNDSSDSSKDSNASAQIGHMQHVIKLLYDGQTSFIAIMNKLKTREQIEEEMRRFTAAYNAKDAE